MAHGQRRGRGQGRGGRDGTHARLPAVVQVLEGHLLGVARRVGRGPDRDAPLKPTPFCRALLCCGLLAATDVEQFESPALGPLAPALLALELVDLVVKGGVELLVDLRGDVGHDLGGVGLDLAVGGERRRVVVVVRGAVLDLTTDVPVRKLDMIIDGNPAKSVFISSNVKYTMNQ